MFVSCGNKQPKRPPIDFSSHSSNVVKIKYDDRDNNQIWIPVKLNGVTMDMLYDTGFNGTISMSLLELQTLAKQGRFSEDDILGTSYSSIADGSIVENGVVRLHTLQIADDIVLQNVNASVAMNNDVTTKTETTPKTTKVKSFSPVTCNGITYYNQNNPCSL
jgi:predicted aspartyl protease